jgi:hypothetical protein
MIYLGEIFSLKEKMPVKFEIMPVIISYINQRNNMEATTVNMNIKIIITVITVTTKSSLLRL